ncbi:hypothetical protein HOM50_04090 [bacterium]|nr:hypothetical protein [bacterium]MBT5015559.1 hypothetical protein [bacterium]
MQKKLRNILFVLGLLSLSLAHANAPVFATKKLVSSSGITYKVRYNVERYAGNPMEVSTLDAEFKKLYTNPSWYTKQQLKNNGTMKIPFKDKDVVVEVNLDLPLLQHVVNNYYAKQLKEVGNREYVSFWVDWKNKFEWHQLNTEKDAVLESLRAIIREQVKPVALTERTDFRLAASALVVAALAGGYYYRDQIKEVSQSQYGKFSTHAQALYTSVKEKMPNMPSMKLPSLHLPSIKMPSMPSLKFWQKAAKAAEEVAAEIE